MILSVPRSVVVLAAGLAVLALNSGCGASNSKGVIEGQWKFVGDHPDETQLRDVSLYFDGDGVVTLEHPNSESTGQNRPVQKGWHYKLLAGDAVDFYDLPVDATSRFGLFRTDNGTLRVTIRIERTNGPKYEGREMTLTDPDGRVFRLVWIGSPW